MSSVVVNNAFPSDAVNASSTTNAMLAELRDEIQKLKLNYPEQKDEIDDLGSWMSADVSSMAPDGSVKGAGSDVTMASADPSTTPSRSGLSLFSDISMLDGYSDGGPRSPPPA